MFGQPFVNPVNFVFGPLLGLVYYAKHPHHYFVIPTVFFTEPVDDCHNHSKPATDRGSKNTGGGGTHTCVKLANAVFTSCGESAIAGEISTCIQSPPGAPVIVLRVYRDHTCRSHRQPRPCGVGK